MKERIARVAECVRAHHEEHPHHAGMAFLAAVFVVFSVLVYDKIVYAATYNFTQSSWAGGADTNSVATHTSNQSNWTKYYSQTGLTAAATLALQTSSHTVVDDGAVLTALGTPTIAAGTTPRGIAISADGTSVYVANNGGTTVSMYSRNTSTGALTALGTPTISTGLSSNPYSVAISPDGTSVYTANFGTNTVSMFSRNTSTGALTALGTPTIAAGVAPVGIAVSPDGTSVYVTNTIGNTISMYSRNTSTGALTALGTPTIATGSAPKWIVISADGTSVYVANYSSNTVSMYSRNTSTGALTALGTPTIATQTSPTSIAISADGTSVYVGNTTSNTVSMYSRNTSTGALTALGTPTIATGNAPMGIVVSPNGSSVYVTSSSGNTVSMYSRNTSTGALTALGTPTIATDTGPNGIVVSADGISVYTANSGAGDISQFSRTTGPGFELGANSSTVVTGTGTAASITLGSSASVAGTVIGTYAVGSHPYSVAYDSTQNAVWVANYGAATVSKLNASTGALIGTYNVGTHPYFVAYDSTQNAVWVANYSSNTVTELNASTGALIGSYGVGQTPSSLAYDSTQNAVWVTKDATSNVVKLDATNGNSLTTTSVGVSPMAVAYDSRQNAVWVANNGSANVKKIAASDGSLVGTYSVMSGPTAVAYDSTQNAVWVGNYGSGTVTKLNATNGGLVDNYTVGANPYGVAFDPATNSIWTTSYTTASVTQLNASTGASVGSYAVGANPQGIAFDPTQNAIWVGNYTDNTVSKISNGATSYYSSGTFTSAPIDMGMAVGFTTLSYTTTLNGQTITIDARAGNTATPDGTWTTWQTGIASGGSISGLAGNRYIQYRANLSTNNTSVTPTLDSVTIGYASYGTSGSLISSVYNTENPTNLVAGVRWTETGTTSSQTIKFQIRTSSDGNTWSGWCGTSITCDGTSYFTNSSGVTLAANHPLRSGGDDQYLQYQVFLAGTGSGTPTLSAVTVQYVVNAPPNFDATYGTNGVSVSQNVATSSNPGAVVITYRVRDTDGSTGTVNASQILPSFEYNIGGGWVAIPSGDLQPSDTALKAVDDSVYITYTATWAATSTIPNTYAGSAQVRVTANDNEAANNTAQAISGTFVLDTKSPTLYGNLDASTGDTTGTVTLSVSDDNQLKYRICNDASFPSTDAQGNSCAWTSFGGNVSSTTTTWTPLADAQGNKPIYIAAMDAKGNTATLTVVAPAAPLNFDLKDITNLSSGSYGEFASWTVFAATTSSSFSSYKLYKSTDNVTYTLLTTITDSAQNYYRDQILTSTSSTQYYKAIVVTSQGNKSSYTSVLSDTPNGSTVTDSTAPVISPASILVPDATLKNTTAVITFTTDELSAGTVQYERSGTNGWSTVTSASYSLAHSISLQGLTPNTTYHLQVKAVDATGNVSDYVTGPDFTTAGGPVITNVNETNLSGTGATITWDTATSSDSYVFYSSSQDLSNPAVKGSSTLVTCSGNTCHHSVDLTGLTSNTAYYFYVQSTDGASNSSTDNNSGLYYSFTTTRDTTAPVISSISTPVISSSAAVIVWQTDEVSTSQVQWGTASTSLSHTTVLDPVQTIYHVVSLSGSTLDTDGATQSLTASTPYFYRVVSADASGNSATSAINTFTSSDSGAVTVTLVGGTPTVSYANGGSGSGNGNATVDTSLPTVTTAEADNVGAFDALINVATNKDTVAFVEYGPTSAYGLTEGYARLTSDRTIHLTHLTEGTTYHYRVVVYDKNGNTASSNDATFKTIYAAEALNNLTALEKATNLQDKLQELIESALPSLAPPFISKPVVSSTTEDSAVVSWTTNVKTYGSLRYASDDDYAANKNEYTVEVSDDQRQDTAHSVTLTGLTQNTLYHVQARSYVFPQVIGKSADITFSTKAAPLTPHVIDVRNDGFTVVWQTGDPTTSIVEYTNTRTGESNIVTDTTMNAYHSVQIKNLPAGTTYVVSASGVAKSGNRVDSATSLRVTTSVDVTPPVISNFKIDNALVPGGAGFIQTVVGWQTDEPANSTVYYEEGAGVAVSSTTELTNKVSNPDTYTSSHIVILPNLRAGTVYRIKVVSADQSGNTKVFGPTSIITPNQSQSVLDIIVKNFENTFKFLGGSAQ